jgi:aminopeptidase N
VNRRVALPLFAVALLVGAGAVARVVWDDGEAAAPVRRPTTTTATTTTTTEAPPQGTPGADGAGDPYFPQLGNGGYDVDHYTLNLTWLADEGVLDGVTAVDATATQDLSRFDLDLSGMDVRSVTVDGHPATVQRSDRELVITPASVIPQGDDFTTIVSYSGRPEPVSDGTDLFEVGWQTAGREAFVVSEPTGAATFFPVNDHPTDKATYTFHVTAPSDQVVAANGLLVGSDDIGHGTTSWTYEARDPMASYLVQIAIGDFELVDAGVVDGVVIRHAFHRSLAEDARAATERTAEMIQVLSQVFGPFPFEAYGVLAVDQGLGVSLETQTLTLIGSDIASAGRLADFVLVHELAHQWVGDDVSLSSWKDIWLNEGLATYAEWLFTERTGGASAAARARQYAGIHEFDPPPGDPGNGELFTSTVYIRGAMTLQALRQRIGDDDFFALLRAWIDAHGGGSASTADLIALAEQVSGEPLDELFQTWLYDFGLPEL